jgi:pimeloyl-ACP methyl ester carboxylesterase
MPGGMDILAKAAANNMSKMGGSPTEPPKTPTSPSPLPSAAPATPVASTPVTPTPVPPAANPPTPVQPPHTPSTTGPLLPTTLATPIVAPSAPTPAAPAVNPPATTVSTPVAPVTPALASPAAAPVVNPPAPTTTATAARPGGNTLISKLGGAKPAALLTKYGTALESGDADKLRAEVEKTDENAVMKSAASLSGVNLVSDLRRLTVPALLLHGLDDPLLDAPSRELLEQINQNKEKGQFLPILEEDLRHFPMLEISAKFNRLLVDFLDASDLVNIQFKDQWKRTMR